jgi:hypothetical protein
MTVSQYVLVSGNDKFPQAKIKGNGTFDMGPEKPTLFGALIQVSLQYRESFCQRF